jgi:hypothetical protein
MPRINIITILYEEIVFEHFLFVTICIETERIQGLGLRSAAMPHLSKLVNSLSINLWLTSDTNAQKNVKRKCCQPKRRPVECRMQVRGE